MLSFLKPFLPKPKIRTVAALQQFLDGEAAYLAQRSIIDFTRNELGSLSAQAFDDPRFQAKLAVSRWEGYAATLADMTVLARNSLVGAGAPQPLVAQRLGDLYRDILTRHPRPDHRAEGWDAEIAALRTRLAELQGSGPGPQALAEATGARIFDTLSFTPRDPADSRMVLQNAFAFGLIAFYDALRRLLVAQSLMEELRASPS